MSDLTPSQLLELRLKAEQSWTGSALDLSMKKNTETAKAILANQTAQFKVLDDPDKDLSVKVLFLNPCGITADDCEENCSLDEVELSSGAKEYAPDICKKSGFSINEEKIRTNAYSLEEQFSKGAMQALGALDEFWSVVSLTKLKTFAGVNAFPDPWAYDNVQKRTNVANFDLTMIPHLINQMTLNNMGDTYFINNGSLFIDFYNAMIKQGNLDGKGDATLIQQLKMYFDQINFGKAGLSEDLFAINRNAVAMKTVNRHQDTPRVITGKVGQTRYTIKSPNLPNVKYDAFYEVNCKVNQATGRDEIYHTWRFETRGLVALNPEGCPITTLIDGVPTEVSQTGVLAYKKLLGGGQQ